ncbi:MAG: hypothetical protein QGH25_22095, partial [Candidatus Latescibacteria bacterium]|nr:hypothetical protein [Candidatus Latescibacterota bacterium]
MEKALVADLADLPVELRLVLYCLRLGSGGEAAERVERLSREEVDWAAFAGLVERHRVVQLVYPALRRCAWEVVPASLRSSLQQAF